MFTVACESCQAPYEVDERRLPPTGLKMRCPKCGTSFLVTNPAAATAPKAPDKPPVVSAGKKTMVGLAPAPIELPSEPPAPLSDAPVLDYDDDLGLDLPSLRVDGPPSGPSMPSLPGLPEPSLPPLPEPIAPAAVLAAAGNSLAPAKLAFAKVVPSRVPPPAGLPGLSLPPATPPIVEARATPFDAFDVDLPAKPAAAGPGRPLPPADLPVAKVPARGLADLDLPTPSRHADQEPQKPRLSDLDLPAPSVHSRDDRDLPGLAAGNRDFDLPMPKLGHSVSSLSLDDLDLPVPSLSDLPVPKPDMPAQLPALKTPLKAGFGDLDLPVPTAAKLRNVAKPSGPGFGELDLPVAPKPKAAAAFGELDLPAPRSPREAAIGAAATVAVGAAAAARGSFGELELPGGDDDAPRRSSGYGEVELAGDTQSAYDDSLGLDTPSMPGDRVHSIPPNRQSRSRVKVDVPTEKKKPVAVMVAGAGLVFLVGAGVASGFLTDYGFFGMYAAELMLPDAGSASEASAVIRAAESQARTDTYADVRASLKKFGSALKTAGLNRELLVRTLVHEGLYQARFGADPTSATRMAAIMSRLEERGGHQAGIALGRAALALSTGDAKKARTFLATAKAEAPRDAYVYLVAGEAALIEADMPGAEKEFRNAIKHGGGARAQWGLARAVAANEDAAFARELEATLVASREHLEARVAKGHLALLRGDKVLAMQLADEATGRAEVAGERLSASKSGRADAMSLLGAVHEALGHRGEALRAFDAALALNGYSVEALLGSGRVLIADTRYRDALARFEAVATTEERRKIMPSGRSAELDAKLGSAQAMLSLDQGREAKTLLAALNQGLPTDTEILLWLGRTESSLREYPAAEEHFKKALELKASSPDAYLALVELYYATQRNVEAEQIFARMEQTVPESADVRFRRGQTKLARNDLQGALTEFRRSVQLDANYIAAWFTLGATARRAGLLDEAASAFERVQRGDERFPGLALERGLVFEARGESEQAAAAYTRALAEHPEDLDLLLRLGSAQVGAGKLAEADETLQKVLKARPTSAEGEYLMGRVAFARQDLGLAKQRFERARDLDSTRGEYHLYVGWVDLSRGDLGTALDSINEAITRDASLGDAFWLRARIRIRVGAVQDAIVDLNHAIELKPMRFEAYADMAEAYEQRGERTQAMGAYERALAKDSQNAGWWYQLGRVGLDAGRADASIIALEHAVTLGDAMTTKPDWLADAHRIRGEGLRLLGQRQAAIVHYRRYLELAPSTAIDRAEVTRTLAALGYEE